jgi:hypothetical protein
MQVEQLGPSRVASFFFLLLLLSLSLIFFLLRLQLRFPMFHLLKFLLV